MVRFHFVSFLLMLAAGLSSAALATAKAERCKPSNFAVAVDVGHTLAAPGATSARGDSEFAFNRELAQAVLAELDAAGFRRSFLIGESGSPLPLLERTRIAQRRGAGLFISIHHDSVQPRYLVEWQVGGLTQRYSDRFHGFSLFVSGEAARRDESRMFAGLVGHALVDAGFTPSLHHAEQIPGEGRPLLDRSIGLYRFDQLAVLRTAVMPATLLEAGIIVNRAEEARSREPGVLRAQARAIARAAGQFCAG